VADRDPIDKLLGRARALCEATTQPGPWTTNTNSDNGDVTVVDAHGMWVAEVGPAPEDAAFIAESRALVPELTAAIFELHRVASAALAWRDTWRHRAPFGDEAKAVALVDAVDVYTGSAKDHTPRSIQCPMLQANGGLCCVLPLGHGGEHETHHGRGDGPWTITPQTLKSLAAAVESRRG
jgi:hypothetical protein